jgi:Lipocalin-like domain
MKAEELALLGVWDLVSFEVAPPGGVRAPWSTSMTGKLIYSASGDSGYVCVGINGALPGGESRQATYQEIFDSILFYTGTFRVPSPGKLEHTVCNASDPNRVGRVLERTYELDRDVLKVSSEGPYGTSLTVWKRVLPLR